MLGQTPDGRGVSDFHDAALSLGEATRHAHMRDAVDEFARGMLQVGLDQFPRFLANAAALAERSAPVPLVRVQFRRGDGPTRVPGGGWRQLTTAEMIRVERYRNAFTRLRKAEPNNRLIPSMSMPNAVPSEEYTRRLEAEAKEAESRAQSPAVPPPGAPPTPPGQPALPMFSFTGPGSEFNVFGPRNTCGVVTATSSLPAMEAPWPAADLRNGAPVPAQVAAQLVGREFSSLDAFRAAFWKAVANVPELAKGFGIKEVDLMRAGYAPEAPAEGQRGRRGKYELHHVQPLSQTGPLYDLTTSWLLFQDAILTYIGNRIFNVSPG